ncbi:hypothetical protein SDC9_147247 [bioreactor metagenome]|uniref:Uncharacterized protein n=1 Tax=bioreactor metagenome TaxID=1076179 RepID=A0A645EHI4_9ZZZZ
MVAFYIEHGLIHIFFIVRQVHMLLNQVSLLAVSLDKRHRVQNMHKLVSQHIPGIAYIHQLAGRRVDLMHFHGFIHHKNGIGGILNDGIGEGFRLGQQKRQAHVHIRLAQ